MTLSQAKVTLADLAADPLRVRDLSRVELYGFSVQAQQVVTACVVELASREHEHHDRLLTPSEAAGRLNISVSTLHQNGPWPFQVELENNGEEIRGMRYSSDGIDEWIKKQMG